MEKIHLVKIYVRISGGEGSKMIRSKDKVIVRGKRNTEVRETDTKSTSRFRTIP